MAEPALRPIFIGGCERSGTTLLGALLGAAPGAVTVPESRFRVAGAKVVAQGGTAADALRRMASHGRFEPWRAGGVDVEGIAPATLREAIESLVRRYAAGQAVGEPRVWIDHTPLNLRYGPTFAETFPDATFVHVVRDGRAVAASVARGTWGPNTVGRAAPYWVERVAHGLALETSSLGARTVRVRYEDLLAEPEGTLRRLCDACRLEFRSAMLQGGRFEVPATSRWQHALVGLPPAAARASAWESELTPRQVEIFESVAGEMLALLGYARRHCLDPRRANWGERTHMRVTEGLRERLVNPWRRRRRTLRDGEGPNAAEVGGAFRRPDRFAGEP